MTPDSASAAPAADPVTPDPTWHPGKHYDDIDQLRADFPGHDIAMKGSVFTGWMRAAGDGGRIRRVGHLRVHHDLDDELATDLAGHQAAVLAHAEED